MKPIKQNNLNPTESLDSEKFLKTYPLPKGWSLKQKKDQKHILFTDEGLSFCPNFSNKKTLSLKQPLVKAIGFKKQALRIIDITSGWAKDAFLMAQLGCHVNAVESHPFVFHLVQASLDHKTKPKNLNFILDNSLNYLNNLKEQEYPDVIYMDPMFGDKKKSLSKKDLRILKKIVGETKNSKELFDLALKKTKKRVVVKRHWKESPMSGNCWNSFKGRSTCYDVFYTKKGIES